MSATPATAEPLTAELIREVLKTPEAQDIINARPKPFKPGPPHTLDEQIKFRRMAEDIGRRYVKIDSATKKPLAEAKEFFWSITAVIPHAVGTVEYDGDEVIGEIRLTFNVQKYYRDEKLMYAANVKGDDGSERTVKKHATFSVRNKDGTLRAPGDMNLDASDFLLRFAPDKDVD
jgi:hypothetical protein